MTEKRKPKFLRKDVHKMSKLGKGRKNKQKWKKPTGRDNKMREKRKGHRKVVSIGYKADRISRGMLEQKVPKYITNILELRKIRENEVPILGKVGMKKKIEIAKEAQKSNIKIHNLNIKKFLKEVEIKKMKKESVKGNKKTEVKKTDIKNETKKEKVEEEKK
jgi:ribosomal protein L32E